VVLFIGLSSLLTFCQVPRPVDFAKAIPRAFWSDMYRVFRINKDSERERGYSRWVNEICQSWTINVTTGSTTAVLFISQSPQGTQKHC
jgi:hypothetical protein